MGPVSFDSFLEDLRMIRLRSLLSSLPSTLCHPIEFLSFIHLTFSINTNPMGIRAIRGKELE